jgi:mRNA-degrading endonuclease toxin of MazEF toxin-antitoxin module
MSSPSADADHRRWWLAAWRELVGTVTRYHWWVLTGAALLAFALGFYGFWQFYRTPGQYWGAADYPNRPHDARFSDLLYWSLKLFVFAAPDHDRLPIALDVARFLAPVVASFAALSGLWLLFRDRLQQMMVVFRRGHVVMCGLGPYVGSVFLRHLHRNGDRVVVIEADANNPGIELCRTLGVPVIVGDAQSRGILESAGLRRAARLLVVCPDDALNAEIISVAREVVRGRTRGALSCLARIGDPDLCRLLRNQGWRRQNDGILLDFFNTDEVSARLLLDEFPIAEPPQQPHILVAHLDPLGQWVIWHAAREWHYGREPGDTRPLVVTVLDDNAETRLAELNGQSPELDKICTFVTTSASAADIRALSEHHETLSCPPLTRAYVTAYRDAQAVETALKLRHELPKTIPMVLSLSRAHGVAALITNVDMAEGLEIDVFMTLEHTCTVELIAGGSWETIAHAIHRSWRAKQLKANKPAPTWAQLDDSRKASSRAQALDIKAKVTEMDYVVGPFRDWETSDFTFSDAEVERLASAEHVRWNKERLDDNWTLIDMPKGKDDEDTEQLLEAAKLRKQSPYLVPFKDLPKAIADYDRDFVREIPALLDTVGLQITRPANDTPKT